MRFIVDVCAGHRLAQWLVSQNHDVVEVRDIDISLSDEEILEIAFKEKRIVVTLDKDFSELVIFHLKTHSGIIRLQDLPFEFRRKHLEKILQLHGDLLSSKVIIIQKGDKIRILR